MNYRQAIVEVKSTNVPANTGLTGDVFGRYVRFIDAKPRTIDAYKRALKNFFTFLQANGDATSPTREDVLNYRAHLESQGLKATTRQSYIIAIRQFFKWTASEGIYPNIADKIKGAGVNPFHKRDYLTEDQLGAVLAGLKSDTETEKRDLAMILLMVTSGLRTIEVSRAKIEDMGVMGGHHVLFVQGKGRDDRNDYVKLSEVAMSAINDYLEVRGETNKRAPLFTSTSNNSKGKTLTTRSISGIVKNSLVNAGFNTSRLTAHSLRHTAVTLSLLNGMPIEEARDLARHTNISTTMVYAHHIKRESNRCVDVLNGIVKRVSHA